MSFYSKEYIKCRASIEKATTFEEIDIAVNELDIKWNIDMSIMQDSDWPKLVQLLIEANNRIKRDEYGRRTH